MAIDDAEAKLEEVQMLEARQGRTIVEMGEAFIMERDRIWTQVNHILEGTEASQAQDINTLMKVGLKIISYNDQKVQTLMAKVTESSKQVIQLDANCRLAVEMAEHDQILRVETKVR